MKGQDRTMVDMNSVRVAGVACEPLLDHAEGQLQFRFRIRTEVQSGSGVYHIPVQLLGQAAHDGLMQYQFEREVNVSGYLEQSRNGRVIVVGTSVFWGRALHSMRVADLEAKLELLKSAEQRGLVQSLDTDSPEGDSAAEDTQEETEEQHPADEEAPAIFSPEQITEMEESARQRNNLDALERGPVSNPCREIPIKKTGDPVFDETIALEAEFGSHEDDDPDYPPSIHNSHCDAELAGLDLDMNEPIDDPDNDPSYPPSSDSDELDAIDDITLEETGTLDRPSHRPESDFDGETPRYGGDVDLSMSLDREAERDGTLS